MGEPIKEQNIILLKKNTNSKIFQVIKNKNVSFCKEKFQLNGLCDNFFGDYFKVLKGELIKLSLDELCLQDDKNEDENEKCSKETDNRNLIDKNENQILSKENIQLLRKQGISGNTIVEQLIENSTTFSNKTEFSQEKYIKKKTKKHVTIFKVLKPNTQNLLEHYYSRGPTKLCNLRMDSLGQILTYSNVHHGCKMLVIETCCGIVVGALLERMSGNGTLVNIYSGSAPSCPALIDGFQINSKASNVLYEFPLDKVATLKRPYQNEITMPIDKNENLSLDKKTENSFKEYKSSKDTNNNSSPTTNKRKRTKEEEELRDRRREEREKLILKSKKIIENADFDGIIVAGKLYPTPILLSLLDFILPSRPIVIFSPYKEPLVDCYSQLRDRSDIIMLRLSETWLRQYQVLENRTHPDINMTGSGGYLLTAIKIKINSI